jgi:hypothetical protein
VGDVGWAFSAWSGDPREHHESRERVDGRREEHHGDRSWDIAAPTGRCDVAGRRRGAEHRRSNSNLTWSASDNAAVTSVDLELSRSGAGGPWESIIASIAKRGHIQLDPDLAPDGERAAARDRARRGRQLGAGRLERGVLDRRWHRRR